MPATITANAAKPPPVGSSAHHSSKKWESLQTSTSKTGNEQKHHCQDGNSSYLHGARERTRTSTPLRELAPEASASANSATRALLVCGKTKLRGPSILTRAPWFVNAAHHHRELLTRLHDRTTLNRWARGEQETKTWLPPAR